VLLRSRGPWEIRSSEITSERAYLQRREFLGLAAAVAGSLLLPGCSRGEEGSREISDAPPSREVTSFVKSPLSTSEPTTAFDSATTYNNFYEFGTDKADPARYSHTLVTKPWSVRVSGAMGKPGGEIGLEDFLKPHQLEERVYRLRCVEAWSMVIPWIGVPLAAVLKRFEPTADAKFVAFQTLYDPKQMPGQKTRVLPWPYQEGLRIDEAMHPLTILAIGMYGRTLPNQNGAPLRLVVPWKYGFKSIKSIVAIELTKTQPTATWNQVAPDEYGFYSNVNPDVDHPRWSQKKERRIGDLLRRDTLPFNGYAEQVASLYSGMDLRKFF